MSTIIFIVCTILVLFIGIQALKKFVPSFFEKFAAFVPLVVFLLAFVATIIFNIIAKGGPDLPMAALLGYAIAATEVYTYEGVYKLFRKVVADFKNMFQSVKGLVKEKKAEKKAEKKVEKGTEKEAEKVTEKE